jgi:hypothetical protein
MWSEQDSKRYASAGSGAVQRVNRCMEPRRHPILCQRVLGGVIAAGITALFWLVFGISPTAEVPIPAVVSFVVGFAVTPGARGRPRADLWLRIVGVCFLAVNLLYYVGLVHTVH